MATTRNMFSFSFIGDNWLPIAASGYKIYRSRLLSPLQVLYGILCLCVRKLQTCRRCEAWRLCLRTLKWFGSLLSEMLHRN